MMTGESKEAGRMGERVAARLAWLPLAATSALVVLMALLSAGREPVFDTALYGLFWVSLATVGALVASRHPGNPIGWLFCGIALYGALTESAAGWGYVAAERGLPAGELGEWIVLWSWVGDLTLWTVVLMLFPDGHLPSRRWRFVPWVSIAGCALALPGQALDPNLGSEITGGTNPFAAEIFPTDALFAVGITLSLVGLLAAILSLFVRFRRAGTVERQQIKWFVFAAGGICVLTPFAIWFETVPVQVTFALAVNGLPVVVGIAMLRHRLYDIDVVLNRALVYGPLTAVLAAVYFGGVATTQALLRALTGGDSQLAVVASTLAIAALFNPLRRRIQALVDRRFYRGRYDAARTLEAYAARLRDETDLATLGEDVVGVVRGTVQPEHASLWLRPLPKTAGVRQNS